MTASALVTQARQLIKDRDDLTAKIVAIEAQLIDLGAGTYSDDAGNSCQVIGESAGSVGDPSYFLAPVDEDKARKLAGEKFSDLFDKRVEFIPCQGFADVVPKLVKGAKGRDLVALCRIPGRVTSGRRAYIKWIVPKK